MHTLVEELLALMPPPGSPWPKAARERWVTALGAVLDVLYEEGQLGAPSTAAEASGDAWTFLDLRSGLPEASSQPGKHARRGTSYE